MQSDFKEWLQEYYRPLTFALVFLLMAVTYFSANYFSELFARDINSIALPFESAIPQITAALAIYWLVYPVYFLPFWLSSKKTLRSAIPAYLFVVFVSTLVYLLLPFKMTRPPVTGTGPFDYLMIWFRSCIDKPYNLLPSEHVSLVFLAAFIIKKERKKLGWFLIAAATLITLSTLFVKQHYILDLVAGFALACLTYWLFIHYATRLCQKRE